MRGVRVRLWGLPVVAILGLVLLPATSGFGQAPQALTRDQLRTRILDLCVLTEAPKAGPTVPVAPKCGCYAKGLVQVMTPEDASYFAEKRALPPGIRSQAEAVYAKCSAA